VKLITYHCAIQYFLLAEEGYWVWFTSGEPVTESFWGSYYPNTSSGNKDDCGLMAVRDGGFWWADSNCLQSDFQQLKVAPICQRDMAPDTSTTTAEGTTTTTKKPQQQ